MAMEPSNERHPSKLCPLGFECISDLKRGMITQLSDGGWCNNKHYCDSLAAPWHLPYDFDSWDEPGILHVNSVPGVIESLDWGDQSEEHMIISYQGYAAHTRRIQACYHEGGWKNAVWLPYFYDDINHALTVWEQDFKHGFAPAISLTQKPEDNDPTMFVDDSGFYCWMYIQHGERWEWDYKLKANYCDDLGQGFRFEEASEPLRRFVKSFA